jgi:hypothetical protein
MKNNKRERKQLTIRTSITEYERSRRAAAHVNKPIEPVDRYKNVSSHARVLPKGASMFIFNIRGEYMVGGYSDALGEVVFKCIALNHPNAKDKYHKWYKENFGKTVIAKTSAAWYKEVPKEIGLHFVDTVGGWDQKNFEHSFEKELVTKLEFKERTAKSEVVIKDLEAFKKW